MLIDGNSYSEINTNLVLYKNNSDYVLCYKIYNDAPTEQDLSDYDSYRCYLGNINDVLVESNAASINISGDYLGGDANVAAGELSIAMNTISTDLSNDIVSKSQKEYYIQIQGVANVSQEYETIVVHNMYIQNTVG